MNHLALLLFLSAEPVILRAEQVKEETPVFRISWADLTPAAEIVAVPCDKPKVHIRAEPKGLCFAYEFHSYDETGMHVIWYKEFRE